MLKKLAEISVPDPELSSLEIIDPTTGLIRTIRIEDHYASIEQVNLSPGASLAVRTIFERARNAFLYAWFTHDLISVAESQGYAALEMAAREFLQATAMDSPAQSLREQLFTIERSGAFDDFPIPAHEEVFSSRAYVNQLFRTVLRSRNHLAHGSAHLSTLGAVLGALQVCADLINHLQLKRGVGRKSMES